MWYKNHLFLVLSGLIPRISSSQQESVGPGLYIVNGTSGSDVVTDDGFLIVRGQSNMGGRIKFGTNHPTIATMTWDTAQGWKKWSST